MNFAKPLFGALALTAAGGAWAQSSVTLYGLLDEGINYVNNSQTAKAGAPNGRTGGPVWSMTTGLAQASRWGLRGTEDLGNGYKAIFVVESGFDVGTGRLQQGGTFFGRQAYIGLTSPNWGSVSLGRQYDSIVDVIGPMQAGSYAGGAFADHPGDIDNVADSQRINNSIKYTSPKFAGVTLTGLYSFGGAAGSFGRNSIWSVGARFDSGPLSVAAGYMHINNPNQSFYGNNSTGSTTANNLGATSGVQVNPIYGGYASAGKMQIVASAAQYTLGAFILGLGYSNIRFQNLNDPASGTLSLTNPFGYTGNAAFNNYNIYTAYYITPALVAGASYNYLRGGAVNGKDSAAYQTINASLDYFLSKRTDVYLAGAYMKGSGVDSTNQPSVPYLVTLTPANTQSQVVARIGIRHKF
ncbi:porin [Caballeronia ptereochthonis]|uniref:Outer membrane protein (Porin) n=1 Tax=Caballeronia ptereochthonis TaxID=1777144 RepID=A0A158CCS2_9BURK|nr:porin [Caballeronia ptereochthonis]SAK80082.1 outer membrane protein (porin) [Caballeronia ptereochthonis]